LVAKKAKGKVWGQFFSLENGRLNWLKASQRGGDSGREVNC